MSKAVKWISGTIIGVVVLLVAAAVVLVAVVDPNDYKDDMARLVREQTGRELVFEGDIGFTFFPWLGLELGPVALGNAPGFAPDQMVSIARAGVSIRILPLLSGNIEVGEVSLEGFALNLSRDEKGRSNWDDLAKGGASEKAEPASEPVQEAEGGRPMSISSLSVGGVRIANASVTWDDRQAGQKAALTDLNLKIGEMAGAKPFTFTLSFGLAAGDGLTVRPELSGIATLDLEGGSASVRDMLLSVLGMKISGTMSVQGLKDSPAYVGELSIAEFSPRNVMENLKIEAPKTSDPAVLGKASLFLKLSGTTNSASLENLNIVLDDTRMDGNASVRNFARPIVTATMNVDDMDVDRYLPPSSGEKGATGSQKSESPSAESAGGAQQEPDLSALRDQNVTAKLTIGKLKIANLRITDILAELRIKDGVLRLDPFSAHLYDGLAKLDFTLNANPARADWRAGTDLANFQAGPFLKDLVGKDHVLGTVVAKADVRGLGLTPDSVKRSLNGTASFAFTDGAINGVNVAKMLRDAFARIKGQPVSGDEPERTDFAELLGSAKITNGHVTNNDLLMKSPLLRVTGKGWADLPKDAVDYLATVTVVGTLKGQEGESIEELSGLPLPIYVKGSLANPSIGLDAKAMAEALFKDTFRKGTKDLEENLRKNILGTPEKSGEKSGGKIDPGKLIKGLFN